MKPCLIVTVGLPRCGKTTWARTQPWPVVCPDTIRLALHGNRFIMRAEPFVWAIAKLMVRALLLWGYERVILDATNTTRARRQEWQSDEWETRFKVFTVSKDTCLSRADDELKLVIERMAAQWEPLSVGEYPYQDE